MEFGVVVLRTAVYLALYLAGSSAATAVETRVSGSVRNAAGNSVAHAYVEALPVIADQGSGTVGNFPNPWIAADSRGRFTLTLRPGKYRIRAKDETDGYPDPSFWLSLDPNATFPTVIVGDKEITDLEVILGAQGGIISGEVQDAHTSKPVVDAKIRIQDARNSDAYIEIFTDPAGHFHYTVPSKPLLITAAAPGYKMTAFEGGAEVTLAPGEHREFQLELEGVHE